MYGHIDRIATGEVGTLLDRFSDRFGSELDREIIVLRKKQQQEVRSVKATVELISAPDSPEPGDDEEEIDAHGSFVLPGFNDMHVHLGSVVKAPEAEYVYKLWLVQLLLLSLLHYPCF